MEENRQTQKASLAVTEDTLKNVNLEVKTCKQNRTNSTYIKIGKNLTNQISTDQFCGFFSFDFNWDSYSSISI